MKLGKNQVKVYMETQNCIIRINFVFRLRFVALFSRSFRKLYKKYGGSKTKGVSLHFVKLVLFKIGKRLVWQRRPYNKMTSKLVRNFRNCCKNNYIKNGQRGQHFLCVVQI